jgi:DNA invertase Pin-like site-specific DNA recombinase
MRSTFGYCFRAPAAFRASPTAEEQLAIIRIYCEGRSLDLVKCFIEQADSVTTPWLKRPAGQQLAACLTPGSQVVVARICATGLDLIRVIGEWAERSITLHMATQQGPHGAGMSRSTSGMTGDKLVPILRAMRELNRSGRSEAVSEGMRARKAAGVKYCRYPGYGFKWGGPTGLERRKPDVDEQGIMARIVEWKRAGFSWYQIARHLLRNRMVTPAGREWSPSRVRRAYFAAVRAVHIRDK